MASPLFLIEEDQGAAGFNVRDQRDGQILAWRFCVEEAAGLVAHLNACYPAGTPAPAHDSLVHEIAMDRIGGEPVEPLHLLDPGDLGRMIPAAIGGPTDPGLWRPQYGDKGVI